MDAIDFWPFLFNYISKNKQKKKGCHRNVTENRLDAVIEMVNENPQITTEQLADHLKVSKRTILRDIEKLKEKEKIAYVGSAKKGHWDIYGD